MPLMKLKDYHEQHFVEGSRPDIRTLRRLIINGEIDGERVGSVYYVRVGEVKPVNHLVSKVLRNDATT
tara:strand:- start:4109 stop:4312 length:204 start_codon:yes stop_codon:yes gene_type:complete